MPTSDLRIPESLQTASASESCQGRSTAVVQVGTDGCGDRLNDPATIAGGTKLGTPSIISSETAAD